MYPRPCYTVLVPTGLSEHPSSQPEGPVGGGPTLSVNRRIFSAILVVGSLTVGAKLVLVLRDLVIARLFGTSDTLDAYLLAFTLPSFAISVVAGSFNAALIPTFVHVRQSLDRQTAQRLLSSTLAFNAVLLALALALLTAAMPFALRWMGSRFTPEALSLARRLSLILLPVLVVSGFSTTWAAVLNADDHFATAAVAPAATALVPIVCLMFSGPVHRVYALATGTVLGYVAEAVIVGIALSRRGFPLFPRWYGLDVHATTVIRQYVPMVAGSLVQGGTVLVNQGLAGMLGSGVTSSLNYGTKVVSLISGIGALSLSTAVLPHFSRMVAQRDMRGLAHTMRTYSALVLLSSLPIAALLVYFSRPIVGLVFQRGAFSAHDADLVARIQVAYVLQLPIYLLSMLMVRLVSAFKANHILLWAALLNLSVNIAVGYSLAKSLGAVGIALTTSVVYLFTCAFLAAMSLRLVRLGGWRAAEPR